MSWDSVVPPFSATDRARVIEDVAGQLQKLSLAEMRGEREKLVARCSAGSICGFKVWIASLIRPGA